MLCALCRLALEGTGQLDARISVLDEEFDEAVLELEAGDAARKAAEMKDKVQAERAATAAVTAAADRDRERDGERERERERERRRR